MSDPEASKWSAGVAFVDGEFCPIGEAKISILDMGVTRFRKLLADRAAAQIRAENAAADSSAG